MPTIKTRAFVRTSKSGETYQFKAPLTVDAHGVFSVNLPEDLAESAQSVLKRPIWMGRVAVECPRVNWRVQGSVMQEVERFIEDVLEEHLTVEVKEELVIRYRYDNNTAGARAADGTLHPNGHWAAPESEPTEERSWAWAGNQNIHANNRPPMFGVGVVAAVYLKTTYSRPGGSKEVYSDDLPGSHWDRNPMRRLNAFIVHRPHDGRRGNGLLSNGKSPSDGIHEIPYSDAAASFFADMMVAMMRLGEQMDSFVGDPENLMVAIERGMPLLTAPTAAAISEP